MNRPNSFLPGSNPLDSVRSVLRQRHILRTNQFPSASNSIQGRRTQNQDSSLQDSNDSFGFATDVLMQDEVHSLWETDSFPALTRTTTRNDSRNSIVPRSNIVSENIPVSNDSSSVAPLSYSQLVSSSPSQLELDEQMARMLEAELDRQDLMLSRDIEMQRV